MAIAVVGTPVNGAFPSGTGISYTAGAGTNRLVALSLAMSSSNGSTPNFTGVQPTYNSVNMTQAGSWVITSTARWMIGSIWYTKEANIPGSEQSIVASWSNGTNNLNETNGRATIYTLSGVDQSTTLQATDSAVGNSVSSLTGAGLAVTAGGIVIANGGQGNNSTFTGMTGYTQDAALLFDFSGGAGFYSKLIGSNGTETPTLSWTGNFNADLIRASFLPAPPPKIEVANPNRGTFQSMNMRR